MILIHTNFTSGRFIRINQFIFSFVKLTLTCCTRLQTGVEATNGKNALCYGYTFKQCGFWILWESSSANSERAE